ncbi:hypothetical protein PVAP13_7KG010073 [Panicum virgatum]|uniref:Uncharacterized protein n=1 Tax=Panicum virgatum TaxID=38727 RepID=A0A8T0QD28_PANVG|nr:hypothetical protein PVAP13_7KG010073 [Panicum virgatum]
MYGPVLNGKCNRLADFLLTKQRRRQMGRRSTRGGTSHLIPAYIYATQSRRRGEPRRSRHTPALLRTSRSAARGRQPSSSSIVFKLAKELEEVDDHHQVHRNQLTWVNGGTMSSKLQTACQRRRPLR